MTDCFLCTFFRTHAVEIYFFYGLAFFVTGVIVWVEVSRPSTLSMIRGLPFLAAFGMVHGVHEWFEMFQKIRPELLTRTAQWARVFLLTLSFILLMEFGFQLLVVAGRRRWWKARWLILIVFVAGSLGIGHTWSGERDAFIAAIDTWCRYSLAVPGAVLAAVGLCQYSHCLDGPQAAFSRDLRVVGLAFLLYGIPGQVFTGPSPLPPSTFITPDLFMGLFHLPIQLLRAGLACVVAIFTTRALRLFDLERQQRVRHLTRKRLEAQRRLTEEMREREALQRNLFQRVVRAQEEERRHIARELHDEAGQALTGLSFELAAVEETVSNCCIEVRQQIEHLCCLTQEVLEDLQGLTARLRPTVLDELGMIPALITYANECSERYPFTVDVTVEGEERRLSSELEITLYRIAQESLTNAAKHAQAEHVAVRISFTAAEIVLQVTDDGRGMEVVPDRSVSLEKGEWGLAGMVERIQLVDGCLDIESTPGEGTSIIAQAPITPGPNETGGESP